MTIQNMEALTVQGLTSNSSSTNMKSRTKPHSSITCGYSRYRRLELRRRRTSGTWWYISPQSLQNLELIKTWHRWLRESAWDLTWTYLPNRMHKTNYISLKEHLQLLQRKVVCNPSRPLMPRLQRWMVQCRSESSQIRPQRRQPWRQLCITIFKQTQNSSPHRHWITQPPLTANWSNRKLLRPFPNRPLERNRKKQIQKEVSEA
jgi:hypothetical protein